MSSLPFARNERGNLSPFHQTDDEQQNARAYGRADNRREPPGTNAGQMERAPEPAADDGADDAEDDVADQAEASAFHDLTGQPAGNGADDEQDNETLKIYGVLSLTTASPTTAAAECDDSTVKPHPRRRLRREYEHDR
jgi:hypothetical protein